MLRLLKNIYLRIGFHTAASGTLLHGVHARLLKMFHLFFPPPPPVARQIEIRAGIPLTRPLWSKKSDGYTAYVEGTDSGYIYWDVHKLSDRVVFDIDRAVAKMEVKGIALIFFMGLGDYIFTTPLLTALWHKFPGIPLHAFISTATDKNNSALIKDLIIHNPHIDHIHFYDGQRTEDSVQDWRNYDYTEALKKVPEQFLAIPLFYGYDTSVRHRVYSLFDTFSLARTAHVLPPEIHLSAVPATSVSLFFQRIMSALHNGGRGIVFVQLDARSTSYVYPYIDVIVDRLVDLGFVVISVTPLTTNKENRVFVVDFTQFKIIDSIHLLKMLADAAGEKIALLTVTSVFGSVSAGLGIRNVQMWHADDEMMPTMWYPVHHVIARRDYPALPQESITVAPPSEYEINSSGLVDYRADFVVDVFLKVVGL
ncbi:MAG: hypothetical protein KGI37_08860 [Alphaproteobacteria bacterium]|nr:hypothetical protein [Alphaproteobacteria bacterium]